MTHHRLIAKVRVSFRTRPIVTGQSKTFGIGCRSGRQESVNRCTLQNTGVDDVIQHWLHSGMTPRNLDPGSPDYLIVARVTEPAAAK